MKIRWKLMNFLAGPVKTTLIFLWMIQHCVFIRFNFEVCAKGKRWRRACELIFPLLLGACCSNGIHFFVILVYCLLIWKNYSFVRCMLRMRAQKNLNIGWRYAVLCWYETHKSSFSNRGMADVPFPLLRITHKQKFKINDVILETFQQIPLLMLFTKLDDKRNCK